MSTKTISITEEAYECLRSLKNKENESFSQIILKHYPRKRTLSEVFAEIDPDNEFADAIESVMHEGRELKARDIQI